MDVVRQRSGSQKELSSNKGFFCHSFLFFLFTSKNSCCFFCNLSCVFFLFSIMNLYHKSHRFDFFVSSVQTRHLQLQIGKKRVKSGKTVNYFLFCSCIELFFFKIFDVHEIRHLSHNSSSLIIIIMALFAFQHFTCK